MNTSSPQSAPEKPRRLPFSGFIPWLTGIAVGLVVRFIFSGGEGDPFATMSSAFVLGAPLIVGAATVFVAEYLEPRTPRYHATAGAFSTLLFELGTIMASVEGWICALIIAPLFAVLGGIGGLIMGLACRLGRYAKRTLQVFCLFPVLCLALEAHTPLPTKVHTIQRSIAIEASPRIVWEQIKNVDDIRKDEVDTAWAFRIGVPTPHAGITTEENPHIRRVRMGRGVYFDQVAIEERNNEYVRWAYNFYADSFPPGSMDDHVRIGGHYFDLVDTSYSLRPDGTYTRLIVTFRYRLSTRFNWYADPILRVLLVDAADAYLALYKRRSEALSSAAASAR